MSDKLLLHARRRSSSGAVAQSKNGGERAMEGRGRGGEGVVSLPPPRHYVTSARCFARRCDGGSAGEEGGGPREQRGERGGGEGRSISS